MPQTVGGRSEFAASDIGTISGCHSADGVSRQVAQRHARAGPRRLDAKPGPTIGEGDIRLRSMKETLKYGQDRGWKQIIFGHVGREPEKSLAKVAARLGRDPRLPGHVHRRLARPGHGDDQGRGGEDDCPSPPGSVIMLQNTRKYDIERSLWKAKPADIDRLAGKTRQVGQRVRRQGSQSLRPRGFFRRQPRRIQRGRSRRDGEGGPGQVRGRAIRRPLEGMPPGARWSSSAA